MTTATQTATTMTDEELFAKVREIQAAAFRKFQQFSAGMELYRQGYAIEACASDEQRTGWKAAEHVAGLPEVEEFDPRLAALPLDPAKYTEDDDGMLWA